MGKQTLPPITNYGDLRLRRPRADWRVGRAERWIADVLDVRSEAVRLVLPRGGRLARSDKTLGTFRREWGFPE
jgi:hypothetical protein